ncbi:hypothetical protein HG536_0B04490 [Torulaspora globosa]|uniref:Uncharacterized protein n=1 Tax=Torulaspora globosa TaxID=48254 RepID=A0A7G3ZDJ9_9SACH|nr:uncharacterized protein HG536_0B04490 [Torulaspora globosa]QLL31585.1 hypothetical protein HG536_0B04490 [Torulaspora globosa]
MGSLSDSSSRRRDWLVSEDDSECFLKPAKFSQDDINVFHNAEATVASDGLLQLQRICDSLQQDNVLITDRVSFGKRIWDLHTYEEDPAAFPIQNVPIKCNILSSMSELLRNRRHDDLSDDSMEKVAKVLDYLRKLSEAAVFNDASKPPKAVERVRTLDPSRSRRPMSGSFSHRKSNRPSAAAGGRASGQKGKELSIDNISKFHEYKPLIVSLHSRLKLLDQKNRRNDLIFDFVLHNICKFILDDCKLLLIDYIEREILNL